MQVRKEVRKDERRKAERADFDVNPCYRISDVENW